MVWFRAPDVLGHRSEVLFLETVVHRTLRTFPGVTPGVGTSVLEEQGTFPPVPSSLRRLGTSRAVTCKDMAV